MPQLGVVKVVAVRLQPATSLVQRLFGGGQRFVGGVNRGFRLLEASFAVGQGGFARLQIQLPRRHLLGERRVRLRQLGQLRAQRLEALHGGLLLLGETPLAVVGHLHARLGLRFFDLRRGARLARFLVRALGHGDLLARLRHDLVARGDRLGE